MEKFKGISEVPSDIFSMFSVFFDKVTSRIPALLEISASKTIDDRLINTAIASVVPELCCEESSTDFESASRLISNVLRGTIVNKRITCKAVSAFSSALYNHFVHLVNKKEFSFV